MSKRKLTKNGVPPSEGHISNWNKIINSVNREDADRPNNSQQEIVMEDHKHYGLVYIRDKSGKVSNEMPKAKASKVNVLDLSDLEDEFNNLFK